MISPIDTNNERRPADLRGRPFDDPEVVARFEGLLDFVFAQIPALQLLSLSIGNEVDGYLAGPEAWEGYRRFVRQVAEHARGLRPGVPIGVKMTYGGLTGEQRDWARQLNEETDLVMVTYYPLQGDFSVRPPQEVAADFAALLALYPAAKFHLLEAGYPSSELCGSSQALQAEFVRQLFAMWDEHRQQIELVNFTWLTDIPSSQVEVYKGYYGVGTACFGEFLGSLGLRTHAGADKKSLKVLGAAAQLRGW